MWKSLNKKGVSNESIGIFFVLSVSFILFISSPIEGYKTSDPLGTLLVSQSILEHGTVKLDNYSKDILDRFEWQIFQREGHTFYSYPLGTSVFMIPFVVIANLTHMDMKRRDHEIILQGRLAALSASLAMLFIYLIARCYFSPEISLFLTLILTFGSAISSTLAVALWSMNLAVIFILWSLILLVKDCNGRKKLNPYLLGFLLFSAFFCRPTSAIFVFSVLVYLLIKNRTVFLRSLLVLLPCLIALMLFSLEVYHAVYPGHYSFVFSSDGYVHFNWVAFLGNLVSPNRGIFIFSPFLLFSFVGIGIFFKKIYRNTLFWAVFMSFILHLILLSKWKMWWGGGGFGNRLLTDSYPSLVFMTLIVFQCLLAVKARVIRRGLIMLFVLLGLFSLFVHSYQGLYNIYTERWNSGLKSTDIEEYIFSWSGPQILANSKDIKLREFDDVYFLGDEILPESKNALFDGWHFVEESDFGSYRWSAKKKARIWINMINKNLPTPDTALALELTSGTYQAQIIEVLVNGNKVGTIKTEKGFAPIDYIFTFNTKLIKETDFDQFVRISIEFRIPGAMVPAKVESNMAREWRTLGISFFKLRLSPM